MIGRRLSSRPRPNRRRELRKLNRRLQAALVMALVFFLIAAVSLFLALQARDEAFRQRGQAIEQRSQSRIGLAYQLAYRALADVTGAPQQRLLMAAEAVRIAQDEHGTDARATAVLSQTLATTGGIPWVPLRNGVLDATVSGRSLLLGVRGQTGDENGSIVEASLDDPTAAKVIYQHSAPVLELATSPGGDLMAFQDDRRAIFLWDRATPGLAAVSLDPGNQRDWDLQFSEGARQVVATSEDGLIALWPIDSLQPVTGIVSPTAQTTLGQNGRLLVASDGSRLLFLRDTATLGSSELLHTLEEASAVTRLAYNDALGILAVGHSAGDVLLWSIPPTVTEAVQLEDLLGPTAPVSALTFSSEGGTLAAGDESGTVWLWSDFLNLPPRPLRGHDRRVVSVRFSPDQQWLVSVDETGETRLWPLAPDRSLVRLAPDSVSCGADPTVGLACATAGRDLDADTEWSQLIGASEPYHPTCPDLDKTFSCVWNATLRQHAARWR